MPTYHCAVCGQPISEGKVVRDESGFTYHYMCRPSGTVVEDGVAVTPDGSAGSVITGIRLPFSTIFTVVSQVLAVIAIYSLVGWLLVSFMSPFLH
jgi:hypothetical protein